MAFGAGGNVDGYDKFGFGAATNQYTINGVTTSNLQFGNTWVNPNYDTVAEVQILGPGASAEYSNFTGATINVITKTGTNDFHGGFTAYGTADTFQANNSGGIIDLAQPNTKYRIEGNAFLGGPIVKEKLLFFVSGAYNKASSAPPQTEFFDSDTRPSAQLRLDYLANNSNTLSAMYDYEHINLQDQGLQPVTGPEVGIFPRPAHQLRIPELDLDLEPPDGLRAQVRRRRGIPRADAQQHDRHQRVRRRYGLSSTTRRDSSAISGTGSTKAAET